MDSRALIEERVRRAVRAADVDPLRDPEAVRTLVDAELAELLLEPAGDEVWDSLDLARHAFDAVAGFGPLQRLFDDPSVEEVWINRPDRVFAARNGRSELTTILLDEATLRLLVERMLRLSGRRLDTSSPFVDAMLPDGSRLHVAIPDVTREHWAVNILRFVVRPRHIADLVDLAMLSEQAGAFIDAAMVSGLNVVVAGGTQSGKTTFLNALLGCVPAHERIVSCEEVFELGLHHPDWIALQTRGAGLDGTGEIDLRRLVRESLRMRPTRLVIGEVRQAEALDLLVAMNSGMPAVATLHANSAREAVTKLCTLPLLAGDNIAADFVVPTVAGCVDLVVHLATDRVGVRRVQEIAALSGRVENGVIEMANLFTADEAGTQRGRGFPPHADRFVAHGFDLAQLLGSGDPVERQRRES